MTQRYGSQVRGFLLYCIAPIACSIAVGFLFYQENVFNRYSGAFQFLASGVFATVFYYLRLFVRPRDASIGFLVLLGLTLLATRSTQVEYILRDVLYAAAIGASIELYLRFFREGAHLSVIYPVVTLAGLYALSYIVFAELQLGILRSSGLPNLGGDFLSLASTAAFFGTLIGGAVGAGITLGEKVFGPEPKGQ